MVPVCSDKAIFSSCWRLSLVGHIAESCSSDQRLCYNCRQPGHEFSACTSPKIVHCYSCGGVGHIQGNSLTLVPGSEIYNLRPNSWLSQFTRRTAEWKPKMLREQMSSLACVPNFIQVNRLVVVLAILLVSVPKELERALSRVLLLPLVD